MNSMHPTNEEEAVPRRPIDSLTPAEFRRLYLVPNRPVVLTGATVGWRAASDWVTADGEPDLPALARLFGQDVVPVADCSRNGRLGGRAAAAWVTDEVTSNGRKGAEAVGGV